MNRYTVNTAEGECQPGSDDQVLKNLLAITSANDMDAVELALLAQLYETVLLVDLPDRVLTVDDIKAWHRRWLGKTLWTTARGKPIRPPTLARSIKGFCQITNP